MSEGVATAFSSRSETYQLLCDERLDRLTKDPFLREVPISVVLLEGPKLYGAARHPCQHDYNEDLPRPLTVVSCSRIQQAQNPRMAVFPLSSGPSHFYHQAG